MPVLWLSPTNHFQAHIAPLAYTWRSVPNTLLGLNISPHFNRRYDDYHSLSATLWFEQHLKGVFQFPRLPKLEFARSAPNGAAVFHVLPGETLPLREVRVYASSDPHALTRFWQTITVQNGGNQWTAKVPVPAAGTPLFGYADVLYDATVSHRKIPTPPKAGACDRCEFCSRVVALTKDQLAFAGVRPTLKRERSIPSGSFGGRDGFQFNWRSPHHWTVTTRKVKDSHLARTAWGPACV